MREIINVPQAKLAAAQAAIACPRKKLATV